MIKEVIITNHENWLSFKVGDGLDQIIEITKETSTNSAGAFYVCYKDGGIVAEVSAQTPCVVIRET